MKIEVEVAALTQAVRACLVVVPNKPMVESMGCVWFEPGKATATDGQVARWVETGVDLGQVVGIDAKKLAAFLSTLRAKSLVVEMLEDSVRFRAGHTRIDLPRLAEADRPPTLKPEDRVRLAGKLGPDVTSACRWVSGAIRAATTDIDLAGVTVAPDMVVGANGWYMRVRKISTGVKQDLLLPPRFVEVCGPGEIGYTKDWFLARSENPAGEIVAASITDKHALRPQIKALVHDVLENAVEVSSGVLVKLQRAILLAKQLGATQLIVEVKDEAITFKIRDQFADRAKLKGVEDLRYPMSVEALAVLTEDTPSRISLNGKLKGVGLVYGEDSVGACAMQSEIKD